MDDPLASAAPRSQPLEARITTPAKAALPRMFLMAITPRTNFNSRWDAVRSEVIDVLKAQKKRRLAMKKVSTCRGGF
jgi:hypothetical protein